MDFSKYIQDTFDFANSVEFKRCCRKDGDCYPVANSKRCGDDAREYPNKEEIDKKKKKVRVPKELINQIADENIKLHKKIYGY